MKKKKWPPGYNVPFVHSGGATEWTHYLDSQGEDWGIMHREDDVRNLGAALRMR